MTQEELKLLDEQQEKGFGYVPDSYDPRDFALEAFVGATDTFPTDFLVDVPFVTHQGQQPSCSAHAVTTMKYSDEGVRLSPRFNYAWSKFNDGYQGWGTSFKNAITVLQEHGAVTEAEYPDENTLSQEEYTDVKLIPLTASMKALDFKSKTYVQSTISDVALFQALYQYKKGILLGCPWYQSYNRIGTDGMITDATGTASGHAYNCIGWRTKQSKVDFIFQNSFGQNWANKGRFYIPADEITDRLYSSLFVTIDMGKEEAKKIDTAYKLNSKKPMMDLKLLLNQGHVLLQETQESGTFYINKGDKLLEITPDRQGLAALTVLMRGGVKGLAIPKAYLDGIKIETF